MNRRDFIANAGAAAAWALIAITVTDCGGKKGPTTPASDCADDGVVSVTGGHTHSVCVTNAQLTAGNAVTLTLTGAGHTHTLSLTAQQVAEVGAGTQVTGTSSTDSGHSHTVTFN